MKLSWFINNNNNTKYKNVYDIALIGSLLTATQKLNPALEQPNENY